MGHLCQVLGQLVVPAALPLHGPGVEHLGEPLRVAVPVPGLALECRPDRRRIDAVDDQQLVQVIQIAALKALENAAELLRRDLLQRVDEALARLLIGVATGHGEGDCFLDQLLVGKVELQLPRLGLQRPDVFDPRWRRVVQLEKGKADPLLDVEQSFLNQLGCPSYIKAPNQAEIQVSGGGSLRQLPPDGFGVDRPADPPRGISKHAVAFLEARVQIDIPLRCSNQRLQLARQPGQLKLIDD